jgi:hypothetical protein
VVNCKQFPARLIASIFSSIFSCEPASNIVHRNPHCHSSRRGNVTSRILTLFWSPKCSGSFSDRCVSHAA